MTIFLSIAWVGTVVAAYFIAVRLLDRKSVV